MFKRPLSSLFPLSPLRRSDRRKLIGELLRVFPDAELSADEDDLLNVKNKLVPDGVLTGKFRTYLEEEGKIFLDPVNGQPLWFTTNNIMVPTVYMFLKFPHLCPIVQTPSPVLEKLQSGADLMIPGLCNSIPQHVRKNDLVAVEIDGGIVAVGFAALDFSGLSPDRHGKAVYILHCQGDELWNMGKRSVSLKQDDQDVEEAVTKIEKAEISEPDWPELSTKGMLQTLEVTNCKIEIDKAFRMSLLYSLHTFSKTSIPELPMPSSLFVSSHIQPYLPSNNPHLQLKKSSWKKAQKFLKEMSKEGLVSIKERAGEVVITSVNVSSPQVAQFEPYELPKVQKIKNKENTSKKTRQLIEMKQLWKPSGKVSSLFEAVGKNKAQLYTASEIRDIVQLYIEKEDLIDVSNRRMVHVNPVLSLFIKTVQPFISRDALVEHTLKDCMQYYSINGGKPHRGPPPRVKIIRETRQGNKAVMRISNLEILGVDLDKVASELRFDCASSASVGAAPGNPHVREVLVQGAHVAAVVACLLRHGVARAWLDPPSKKSR